MKQIRLLDPTVANQIAAGEVVTRPAAVVKELLENSVDASAQSITLRLSQAGSALINVIDDGVGIPEKEIPLAFARHATSKITSSADIFKINTLGFRGEALASISSVAEVEMKTRTALSETGLRVLVKEGSVVTEEEVAMPQGTSISVYNLFYNTPARRKFLKSEAYEKKLCIEEFEHVALANPDIAFTLIVEEQTPVTYPKSTLSDRVRMIAGKKISDNLIHISLNTNILSIEGWTASASCQIQGTREMYFFVNGRYMNPRLLCKAVISAYGKLLQEGKSVPCFIYLTVDPQSIDVNVHPTKAEIKFDNEKEVWDLVRTAVRKGVGVSYEMPELDFQKKIAIDIPLYSQSSASTSTNTPKTSDILKSYNPFDFSVDEKNFNVDEEAEKLPFTEDLPSGFFIADTTSSLENENGQEPTSVSAIDILRLSGKYFAFRSSNGAMVIVNYPRACERIEYERLLGVCHKEEEDASLYSQRLLMAETVTLDSTASSSIILDNSDLLSRMGFDIGDLGSGIIAVYAVPSSLGKTESIQSVFDNLVSELSGENHLELSMTEKLAASLAHSYARRQEDQTVSSTDLCAIAEALFKCEEPKYTPLTSLPTMWVIDQMEIDKKFRR